MKTTIKNIILVVAFAFVLTMSSLFWTKDIAYDTETIKHLGFGWPFSFYVQDQSRFDPPFPYPMRVSMGNPSTFQGVPFAKSFGINLLIVTVLWYCSKYFFANFRRSKQ